MTMYRRIKSAILGPIVGLAALLLAGTAMAQPLTLQDHHLVNPFLVVTRCELRRIAGVAQPLEMHTLDHLTVANVKAGDDPFRQHGENS